MGKKKCKYEKTKRVCSCGKEFILPEYNLQKYCSRECWKLYHTQEVFVNRKEERLCPCGTKFVASKKSKKRFCSTSCVEYRKACDFGGYKPLKKIEREIRTCECGTKFEVCVNSTQKWCSHKCSNHYMQRGTKGKTRAKRITLHCLTCNKEILVTEAQINRKKAPKFCSFVCYTEGFRKGLVRQDQGEVVSATLKRKYKSGELVSKCKGKTYKEMFGDAAEDHLQKVLFNNTKLGIKTSSWEEKIIALKISNIKYTGNRAFWVSYEGKYKNPDFIIEPFSETRKVIEVIGRYWHPETQIEELKEYYAKHQIRCLFLYDEDFTKENLFIEKVNNYASV